MVSPAARRRATRIPSNNAPRHRPPRGHLRHHPSGVKARTGGGADRGTPRCPALAGSPPPEDVRGGARGQHGIVRTASRWPCPAPCRAPGKEPNDEGLRSHSCDSPGRHGRGCIGASAPPRLDGIERPLPGGWLRAGASPHVRGLPSRRACSSERMVVEASVFTECTSAVVDVHADRS